MQKILNHNDSIIASNNHQPLNVNLEIFNKVYLYEYHLILH